MLATGWITTAACDAPASGEAERQSVKAAIVNMGYLLSFVECGRVLRRPANGLRWWVFAGLDRTLRFPFDAIHLGQGEEQGLRAVAGVALGRRGAIKLLHEGRAGHHQFHPPRLGKDDP